MGSIGGGRDLNLPARAVCHQVLSARVDDATARSPLATPRRGQQTLSSTPASPFCGFAFLSAHDLLR